MTTKYTHLQPEDRMTIASLHQQGYSFNAIAAQLGRSPSTISREFKRNCSDNGYASKPAQQACLNRRVNARPLKKLHPDSTLWFLVSTMLCWYWSPQQIAKVSKMMNPNNKELQVSHETIYNCIYAYPRGDLKKQLIQLLRHGHSNRKPRKAGVDRRGKIPDMVSIHVRPPEATDRQMPGNWEGDLIKGEGNRSAVGVLVDRSTLLVLLCKMKDSTAVSALEAFSTKFKQIAEPQLRQTMTYDQGKEMALHKELTEQTGVQVYFCDPHSPWQRGICENTNGLLRQFLPKGEDLSKYDQDSLDSIADLMNNRPRATLNWLSPIQAFKNTMKLITEKQGSTIQ